MHVQPLSWLKSIQDEMNFAKTIPLWGSPPAFPWDFFTRELQNSLEIKDLSIALAQSGFLDPEEFLVSFGKRPVIKTFELAPLPGAVHWVLSSETVESICQLALSSDPETALSKFTDPSLQEGFYQYLLLCCCSGFATASPYPDFHLQWIDPKPLPSSFSFCADIQFSLHGKTFMGRLIFSSELHKSFVRRFTQDIEACFNSPLLGQIDIPLSLQAGSCQLPQKDWKRLRLGDFLVLDTCSYDPEAHKGTATLSLHKKPLFQIKVKKDSLKILDYCTHYEEDNAMDDDMDMKPFLPDDLGEDDFSDLETPPDEKESVKEKLSSSLDIPLPIVVEIDRLHMPLKKLLSLEPGNILELSARVEQGVYLTVHGKKIAKGELLKIGDAIGVRILELGEEPSRR